MKKLVLVFGMFLSFSCSLPADQSESGGTWGEDTRYHEYERFYITSQPDLAALEQGQKSGLSIVINLRGLSESDWDEAGATESLGLEYYQVPINGSAPQLESEPFDQISAVVEANPDATILVHCASGNRAAAWLAVYLAEYQAMSPDEAIEIARANGLTSEGLQSKVRVLLEP